MTIYIYSNENGKQIDRHRGASSEECEQWASWNYGDEDYHWSYVDMEESDAGLIGDSEE